LRLLPDFLAVTFGEQGWYNSPKSDLELDCCYVRL
jgi:hypothetical protein